MALARRGVRCIGLAPYVCLNHTAPHRKYRVLYSGRSVRPAMDPLADCVEAKLVAQGDEPFSLHAMPLEVVER